MRLRNVSAPAAGERRRGAAIVEMAFVVVILLTLTLGLIQWGMIMNTSIAITNLSREGARYAAVHYEDDAIIEQYVKENAPPGVHSDDIKVRISPERAARSPRTAIEVTVDYDMSRKLFLPAQAFQVQFFSGTYSATGQMMIE